MIAEPEPGLTSIYGQKRRPALPPLVGVGVGLPRVIVKVRLLLHPAALVYRAVWLALAFAVTVISRDVELNPLGPLHDQDPPVVGCGPNLTLAPALTVTLAVCVQLPPFTCVYGVIAVGV